MLKWSTKYEAGSESQAAAPAEFDALATAASISMQGSSLHRHNNTGRRRRLPTGTAATSPIRLSRPLPTPDIATAQETWTAAELEHPDGPPPAESRAYSAVGSSRRGSDGTPSANYHLPTYISNNAPPCSGSGAISALRGAREPSAHDNPAESSSEMTAIPHQGPAPEMSGQAESCLGLRAAPLDESSYLIEIWFKSVCGSWAAYDSPLNPIRRLCSSLWGSSASLYYSLQSMAAATLPAHQAKTQEIASLAPQMATRAIIQDLELLFEVPTAVSQFPAGLVMSLFCMSSSLSWIDHRQLGLQYLGHARTVISLLEMRAQFLCDDDRELLRFFKGCLIYEEAMRSIVTSRREDIKTLLEWSPATSSLAQFELHAWTGVPPQIFGLLGKAMALCRSSRDLWRRRGIATYRLMQEAASAIEEAADLEEKLLSVEVPYSGGELDGAADQHDRRAHLHCAAEAYRLSSLLQLYQSFPDLISRRLPDEVTTNGSVPQGCWLTPLSLHIANLLARIPHDSGMRCLQPLLCLCAGSGLKHDLTPAAEKAYHEYSSIPSTQSSAYALSPWPIPDNQSLDVHQAREFLSNRLTLLEQGLPTKPILVIHGLLGAIWQAYDNETEAGQVHWLDIMIDMNYESVFG